MCAAEHAIGPQILYFMSVGCLSKFPVPLHVALRVPRSSASTLITLQVPCSVSTTPCSALWPRDLLMRFLCPGSLHGAASRAAALSCSPCRMHPCLTMPSLHPALQGLCRAALSTPTSLQGEGPTAWEVPAHTWAYQSALSLSWVKVARCLTCFGEAWFLFLLPSSVFWSIT